MLRGRVVSVTAVLACLARASIADGTFVWRNESADIREPEQKAIVLFDDGLEDLVLEVRFEGAPGDFGWIVPLPSRPRLRADDSSLFVRLSQATQGPHAPRSERTRRMTATMGASTMDDVTVLQRARIGIYEAAVLEARGGGALAEWLRENGFRAPPGAPAIFGEYARRGWVFVALRISPSQADSATRRALASGTIQPIRFRFRTPEPVYPLRISALGGSRSEILLYVVARRPLVHRTCDRAAWTEYACGPVHPWIGLDPDSTFPGLANGRGFLTKLRASLMPGQMEDLYFRPYDPVPGLSSADERQRIEAVAHLGWIKPPNAAQRLAAFVRARPGGSTETITALWALGQVGGREAVATLTRQAARGPHVARVEAMEGLALLGAREALPLYVRGLTPGTKLLSRLQYTGDATRIAEACGEHLVAQADSTCLVPLRRLLRRTPGPGRNASSIEISTRDRVLAALAAAGDRAARDTIVARLTAESALSTRAALRGSLRDRGSANYFPSGFWPALHLLHQHSFVYGGCRQLEVWHRLLAGRPLVHDDVLRRAAAHPGMTDVGRTMLLGLLARPEPTDADALLSLARRGLGAESLHVVLRTDNIGGSGEQVRYNVPVCVAAYALARHRAVGALMTLWRECPTGDRDLRGELALALCEADTDLAVPLLVDYVRSEWNERAGSPDFLKRVLASVERRRPQTPAARAPGDHDLSAMDVGYRVRAITSRLAHRDDPESLVRLITDRSLHPWLRLFWAHHARAYEKRLRPSLPAIRSALDDLARSHPSDEVLQRGIEGARRHLDIGDGVYARHVARSGEAWR